MAKLTSWKRAEFRKEAGRIGVGDCHGSRLFATAVSCYEDAYDELEGERNAYFKVLEELREKCSCRAVVEIMERILGPEIDDDDDGFESCDEHGVPWTE